MGIWHKPSQVALAIKKIQQDYDPRKIFEYEKNIGWTDATSFRYWMDNTKTRILKLTGKTIYSYIKSNTIYYRNMINQKIIYEAKMAKRTKTNDSKIDEILNGMDKEELIILIKAFKKRVEDYEEQESKKKQEKIKSQCISYLIIKDLYKQQKRRLFKNKICLLLDIPVRTLNDKIHKNNIFLERKIRSDSIIHSPKLNAIVNDVYWKHNGVYGQKRIYETIIRQGFQYTFPTICNALRKIGLYANEVKVKPKKYEDKNTSITKEYLLSEEKLKTYKPGEAFSIDFSQIETANGKMWLHGARDIVTKRIEFLFLCYDQTKETVLSHYRFLPKTTKIVNTDHGSSYLSHDVQKYLESRDIKQSLGDVGCSYHNRWIEDFWKRIKYEWFQKYPTKKVRDWEIRKLLKDYKEFHNNVRLTKINGVWTTPSNYALNFIK